LALKRLNADLKGELVVCGDIGCYTLGVQPPFDMMDSTVCMGAAVGMAHGMQICGHKYALGVLGDSTFVHGGITGLVNTVYNMGKSTLLILDNSTTGMTGHQENPTSGLTVKGVPTKSTDLVMLCKAIGMERVVVVDPFDVDGMKDALRKELEADEPSVVIAKRPCSLLKTVKFDGPYKIADDCVSCGLCAEAACPAISQNDGYKIDISLCLGCGFCVKMCPTNCIVRCD
jgi:indolepyruvate ferredoxin oxidoreductase alpha subunit